ncbi:Serpin superfamily [Arabidopsis suecica]|uniref:Serpin superfamily n=1 Tax=Arabidopsis suecica TaxID=45249 RepID=A0A8T2BPL3_ARASU|nr:Serpin superfamily [Arabidopsis suecica]
MDVRAAMKNQTEVAMILSGHFLTSAPKDSNIIFSPASINSAITMHAAGPGGDVVSGQILYLLRSSSLDELKTVFRELASVVYADSSSSGGPKITAANGLWIDKSLPTDPKFKDLFENFFKAVYVPVDFQSKAEEVRIEVNSWVEHHTNNLIKNLLPDGSVTSLTDKIYANALYFKGAWKRPFEKFYTKDRDFHLVNGITVSVPFMTSYENQYVRAYDGFKVLRLPYRRGSDDTNRKFSMYFYLPDKKDGLDTLVEKIVSTTRFLDSHIPTYRDELEEFRIPKFKIEFGFSVTKVLNRLGLRSMSMYHKACVEIDEEGAEAAAATADEDLGCALEFEEPPKKIDFVADHPFLFLIREEKTGTVLFVGQIFNPLESCSGANYSDSDDY